MTSVLEDKEQIRELLANYCFHSDSGEAEAFVGLFTQDGILDLGDFAKYQGREALLEAQKKKGGKPTPMRHHTNNIVITINGDAAQAKSYVVVFDVSEQIPKVVYHGHYFDDLVRENGKWLFKRRRARPLPIEDRA